MIEGVKVKSLVLPQFWQTQGSISSGICPCSFSRQQHGRSETEEYSSESESESEDEEELQVILEDLQRQNEELEVGFDS